MRKAEQGAKPAARFIAAKATSNKNIHVNQGATHP